MKPFFLAVSLAAWLVSANPVPAEQTGQYGDNDYACRSTKHPNPVVTIHALGVNKDFDLNFVASWLRPRGFCTFSLTYGNAPGSPMGGLDYVNNSAPVIADFIKQVASRTGASKVDLVGHSEGAFMSLYIPKLYGVSQIVDKIVAVAPPTHGSTYNGLWTLAQTLGPKVSNTAAEILKTFGCRSCTDVVTGSEVIKRFTNGPIVQPGNTVTIIATKFDTVVTPPASAFVEEPGVTNIFIQDDCRWDAVGHIALAVSPNMWNLVLNSLEGKIGRKYRCINGIPFLKRDEREVAARLAELDG